MADAGGKGQRRRPRGGRRNRKDGGGNDEDEPVELEGTENNTALPSALMHLAGVSLPAMPPMPQTASMPPMPPMPPMPQAAESAELRELRLQLQTKDAELAQLRLQLQAASSRIQELEFQNKSLQGANRALLLASPAQESTLPPPSMRGLDMLPELPSELMASLSPFGLQHAAASGLFSMPPPPSALSMPPPPSAEDFLVPPPQLPQLPPSSMVSPVAILNGSNGPASEMPMMPTPSIWLQPPASEAPASSSEPLQPLQPPSSIPRLPMGVVKDHAKIMSIFETGLLCSNPSAQKWAGGRCAVFAPVQGGSSGDGQPDSPGKSLEGGGVYYFEVEMLDPLMVDAEGNPLSVAPSQGGILRVGLSTPNASLALGTDDESFGYGGTGMKCSGILRYDDTPRPGQPPGSAFAPYGGPFGVGDIIGVLLDRTNHTISYVVNGYDHGIAFELPDEIRKNSNLHPAITIKGCAVRLNLGDTPLQHLPAGAQSFAAIGLVDEASMPSKAVDGTVIGRSWNVTQSDTSAHLIDTVAKGALSHIKLHGAVARALE